MGLFDSYAFDPSTFATNGGLVGRIMSQLQMGQYQPGFGAPPMEAQAAMPSRAAATVPQAAPIAIGDYMMPRVGPASAYEPQQASPAAAPAASPQPAQYQGAPDAAALLGPAPRSEGGFGSVLQGALANAHNGPIGMLLGGIAGAVGMGQGTPQQQTQQTLRQRYQALLLAGIPKEHALLAAIDPEGAGKTIVSEALGPEKFTFAQLPDGTVVRQNARTGEVAGAFRGSAKPTFGVVGKRDGEDVYGWSDPTTRQVYGTDGKPLNLGASPQAGTITGPDGRPISIPQGVDRKEFVREVTKANADAATGKMTETQAKASSYAARMEQAENVLGQVGEQGGSYIGNALKNAPLIGGTAATNWAQSADYERFNQAKSAFVTALLRQESGAAISKEEFNRYDREYFPQPGEGAAVIKQKAELRKTAIEQMKRAAGPGYKSPTFADQPAPGKTSTGVKWSVE